MTAAIAFPIRTPQWTLTYAGVNITADISAMVTSICYLDCLDGASGSLAIELEDHDKRWQGTWQPIEGDHVNLMIGYAGSSLLPCGDFEVDDLSLTGPPDLFHLRCLAAYITPTMRTPNSTGYESQTLKQIASTIASKHGLTLITDNDAANLTFARITQCQETDLAFLHRLARTHNYEFTIRGGQLIFYGRGSLEMSAPAATIGRSDLVRFDFRLKTHRIYKAAEASYQFADTKQLLTRSVAAATDIPTGDTLKLAVRCENGQQADLKAASALHGNNMIRASASLRAVGSTSYAAGSVVTVQGFGFNDGEYLIERARHHLERATGYTTELEMRSVD